MCGINGFSWADEGLVRAMNERTHNRGPDDEGIFVDEQVSLGHCRLSIIDLSPKGHQPMCNEDGTVQLIFNGEIYNFKEIRDELIHKGHSFTSRTDSEVIIHAWEQWGTGCFDMFNGMWAFCIYDRTKQQITLCRDRFGIKPLFYHHAGGRLIFSSMISAILAHKDVQTKPSDKAIMQFLAYNLEHHNQETFFENIYSLEPGNFLQYDLKDGSCNIAKWYKPRPREFVTEESVRQAFIDSVKSQTVADVPIGSCLSGGVDSSAIVCTLDKFLDYPFYTFSFSAPGTSIDETRYIQEVGKGTKTKQFFTQMSQDDFLTEIDDFVAALEEPVLGLSPYAQYRVMKLAREHGAKVLLDGQGGDEIFAGYVYYFAYRYVELWRSWRLGQLMREMVAYRRNFKNIMPVAMFAFMLLPRCLKGFAWRTMINRWINHDYLKALGLEKADPRWDRMSLDEALHLTLFETAIPHLLRWEDKNSMRWSIESRVPFLDLHLVETALSLPSDAKLKDGRTKVIFKKAIDDILPKLISQRRDKIGFGTPVDDFFRLPKIVDFLKQILYSDSFRSRPYWSWPRLEKMFTAHISGKKNFGKEIWKCLNLELWLRKFFPVSTTQ